MSVRFWFCCFYWFPFPFALLLLCVCFFSFFLETRTSSKWCQQPPKTKRKKERAILSVFVPSFRVFHSSDQDDIGENQRISEMVLGFRQTMHSKFSKCESYAPWRCSITETIELGTAISHSCSTTRYSCGCSMASRVLFTWNWLSHSDSWCYSDVPSILAFDILASWGCSEFCIHLLSVIIRSWLLSASAPLCDSWGESEATCLSSLFVFLEPRHRQSSSLCFRWLLCACSSTKRTTQSIPTDAERGKHQHCCLLLMLFVRTWFTMRVSFVVCFADLRGCRDFLVLVFLLLSFLSTHYFHSTRFAVLSALIFCSPVTWPSHTANSLCCLRLHFSSFQYHSFRCCCLLHSIRISDFHSGIT